MLVVAALGGNALLRPGDPPDVAHQRTRVHDAAGALARVAAHHDLVVTHGNGPQVGLLAAGAQAAGAGPVPLDVLDAQSEGMIGYWIDQELSNLLPGREVATLLTQVVVRVDDPAFAHPTKPIGTPGPDGRRRLVPSPEPREIVELRTIAILVRLGVIVVCAGGGGIPVVRDAGGGLRGVEAVIDKDLAAALLAIRLGADALLLLTDVDAVYADWPERSRPLRHVRPGELARMELEPGSMEPKAEAARRFAVSGSGRVAGIGALEDAERILAGRAGTRVSAEA